MWWHFVYLKWITLFPKLTQNHSQANQVLFTRQSFSVKLKIHYICD